MRKPYITVTIRLSGTLQPLDGWVVRTRADLKDEILADLEANAYVPPANFLDRLLERAISEARTDS